MPSAFSVTFLGNRNDFLLFADEEVESRVA